MESKLHSEIFHFLYFFKHIHWPLF